MINKTLGIPFIIFFTLFAIGINYCGSLLAETIVFPLYLDSVLSISVVAICGYVPGLICALGSNFLLSIFTHSTYLFSICHIMTVTFAWQIVKPVRLGGWSRATTLSTFTYSLSNTCIK